MVCLFDVVVVLSSIVTTAAGRYPNGLPLTSSSLTQRLQGWCCLEALLAVAEVHMNGISRMDGAIVVAAFASTYSVAAVAAGGNLDERGSAVVQIAFRIRIEIACITIFTTSDAGTIAFSLSGHQATFDIHSTAIAALATTDAGCIFTAVGLHRTTIYRYMTTFAIATHTTTAANTGAIIAAVGSHLGMIDNDPTTIAAASPVATATNAGSLLAASCRHVAAIDAYLTCLRTRIAAANAGTIFAAVGSHHTAINSHFIASYILTATDARSVVGTSHFKVAAMNKELSHRRASRTAYAGSTRIAVRNGHLTHRLLVIALAVDVQNGITL